MAGNSCSYLNYLDRFLDEYNNTYHCSIGKKPMDTCYYALAEEIETNPKAPKFKISDRIRITKYKIIFSKGYTNNWSREIFRVFQVALRGRGNPPQWRENGKFCWGIFFTRWWEFEEESF